MAVLARYIPKTPSCHSPESPKLADTELLTGSPQASPLLEEEGRGSDGKWATSVEAGWAGLQPSPACRLCAASIGHKERPGQAHFQAPTALHDSGEDKQMQNIGTAFVAALRCRQNRALGLGCKNKSSGIGCVFMPKPCFLQLNQTRLWFVIS